MYPPEPTEDATDFAHNLLAFVDECPTPHHAVEQMAHALLSEDFVRLHECDTWDLKPGGRYFVIRQGSALVAFTVGHDDLLETGFRIVAAHTDSPALVLKPNAVLSREGYVQLGIQTYGSGHWTTWFNRDLGIAGRIVKRNEAGPLQSSLVRFDGLRVNIPMLAIHLTETANPSTTTTLDPQLHLLPVVGLSKPGSEGADSEIAVVELLEQSGHLHNAADVLVSDFQLCDLQPSTLAGWANELISAPRLDNLASCHAALSALVHSPSCGATCVFAAFDNEEVGSVSARGAESNLLASVLARIAKSPEEQARAMRRSLLVSADMAHAVHPNYPEVHDPNHKPVPGRGPVLKVNANERYATELLGNALFVDLCERHNIPHQVFVVRAGARCGSTVGPKLSAQLGVPTIDIGSPLLSMHAIRECASVEDHLLMTQFLEAFFGETHLRYE